MTRSNTLSQPPGVAPVSGRSRASWRLARRAAIVCAGREISGLADRSRRWLALLGLVWLGTATALGAGVPVSKEYQIKAAFLYNFTKFVEWPAGRFVDETSPIIICVLGENPFGDELERLVQGRKVNGRAIVVRLIASVAEAGAVHLLFVPACDEKQLGPAAPLLRASAVLTVGESARFTALAGIINFTVVDDKVRFEINIAEAGRSQLKVSAQLQKLATLVRHEP